MRSFQSRIALFFSILLIGSQGIILACVYWVSRTNVIDQLDQNLLYAERFFNRLIVDRGDRMASETRILVADYGFRSTASQGDAKTIGSALENLIQRIHGHRAFYVALDQRIVADTAGQYRGTPFMFPEALTQADERGKAVLFGFLNGELYEWAVVPVLAPIPVGWVTIAMSVDRRLVEKFKHLATLPLEISLTQLTPEGARILASSLPVDLQRNLERVQLDNFKTDRRRQSLTVDLGTATFITRLENLPSANADQTIQAALQIDLAEAIRPYRILGYAVAGLLVLGLFATLLGSWLIAGRLAKPVKTLASASKQAMDGQLNGPLPITGQDELGRLAETFNRAAGLAAQLRRMERKDQRRRELVATVSHDLRTPLTSLHGFLETLRRKADDLPQDEQRRFLDVALRQTEKVNRLAQELFELAKLECDEACVQWEDFCLQELIQDVVQKYRLVAGQRGVRLETKFMENVPPIRADIGLIERALTNLVDNALKHTPTGGEVRVGVNRTLDRVEVAVADTGVGIAPAMLPRLFDWDSPFRRRSLPTTGGLGLIVVAKILELHGGTIRAESALGQGSIFSFDLPIAPQSTRRQPTRVREAF